MVTSDTPRHWANLVTGKGNTGLSDNQTLLVALLLGPRQKNYLSFQQSSPRSDKYTGFKADLGSLRTPVLIFSQQDQKRSSLQVKAKSLGEALQPYVHQYSSVWVRTTALG